jgi:[ribosomal protein S18]-alanine N-acetyltransferase
MSTSLRAALPPDYEAIAAWVTDAAACKRWAGSRVAFPFAASELPALLAVAGAASYVLTNGNHAPCGFGQHWPHRSGAAHLGRIIVSPALRGNGYGRELVAALKARALQVSGASTVSLNVYRDNVVALNLYKSLGFVPIESESTPEALFMATPLTTAGPP